MIEIVIMIGPGLAFVLLGDETRFPAALVAFGWRSGSFATG